jgi:zinc protease
VKKNLTILIFFLGLNFLTANPQIETFELPNGLKVILSPMEGMQSTCIMMYHTRGIIDDPPEIKGASLLFRNFMMFLGTENLRSGERFLFTEKNGGLSKCKVNYDNLIFFQLIPEFYINNALWLESERISSLKITNKSIKIQKTYIYQSFYRLINTNIHFKAFNWIKSQIFKGTVYTPPLYENPEEIRSLNDLQVIRTYNNYKSLKDIILVISGKFDQKLIKKYINDNLGKLSSPKKSKPKSNNTYSPRTEHITTNWQREKLKEHFVIYGIRGPSKFSHDYLYFDFIRHYLVDDRISILDTIMNGINKLNVKISYEYTNYSLSNAFIIKVSTSSRSDLYNAKIILNKQFKKLSSSLREDRLTSAELKRTKILLELDFLKKMADLEQRSILLAENFLFSRNLTFARKYIERIKKISSRDIKRISQKYFNKNNQVILNVYSK